MHDSKADVRQQAVFALGQIAASGGDQPPPSAPTGSNPGGGGGGNSAGWSGKFEFGKKKHDPDRIEEDPPIAFHVEHAHIGVPIPENAIATLSDALLSAEKGTDENDDDEAFSLLARADDEARQIAVIRLTSFIEALERKK